MKIKEKRRNIQLGKYSAKELLDLLVGVQQRDSKFNIIWIPTNPFFWILHLNFLLTAGLRSLLSFHWFCFEAELGGNFGSLHCSQRISLCPRTQLELWPWTALDLCPCTNLCSGFCWGSVLRFGVCAMEGNPKTKLHQEQLIRGDLTDQSLISSCYQQRPKSIF